MWYWCCFLGRGESRLFIIIILIANPFNTSIYQKRKTLCSSHILVCSILPKYIGCHTRKPTTTWCMVLIHNVMIFKEETCLSQPLPQWSYRNNLGKICAALLALPLCIRKMFRYIHDLKITLPDLLKMEMWHFMRVKVHLILGHSWVSFYCFAQCFFPCPFLCNESNPYTRLQCMVQF